MIIDSKHINLFGKTVFVKAKIKTPCTDLSISNHACFFHVSKGEVTVFSENNANSIKTHQSLLLKCGHYPTHFKALAENEITEILIIHFHKDVLKKVYEDKLPSFFKSNGEISTISGASVEASKFIDKYVEDLHYYFNHPNLINPDILTLKIKEIILLLLQTDNPDKITSILKDLFCKKNINFKQVIENHLFSNISIKELAFLTNLSLSSFKKHFNVQFGLSPSRYILNKRLEKARYLLESSNLTVSEICYTTGFNNLSHFSKKFKEVYGFPPSHIKKAK